MEAEGLEKPFTRKEFFGALSDFKGNKAPGSNGFSMAFWQFSWSSLRMR